MGKNSRLPDNPEYAHLSEKELLLKMAEPLLKELEENPTGKFSFGGGTAPMKNSELLLEAKELTPLGKEFLGTWFSGIQEDLEHYENLAVTELRTPKKQQSSGLKKRKRKLKSKNA